jgi:hypothetical protein
MNKCRLQRLESRPGGNLKRRLSRDLNIRYSSHLHGCLDHLDMAEAHLFEMLEGDNKFGLITNIANARYEVKKYLLPERVNNECGS